MYQSQIHRRLQTLESLATGIANNFVDEEERGNVVTIDDINEMCAFHAEEMVPTDRRDILHFLSLRLKPLDVDHILHVSVNATSVRDAIVQAIYVTLQELVSVMMDK